MKPHCKPYCNVKISSRYNPAWPQDQEPLFEAWHPILGVAYGDSKKTALEAYAKWVSQIESGDEYVLTLLHPEDARWKREYILRGGEGQIKVWTDPRGGKRNEVRQTIEAKIDQ